LIAHKHLQVLNLQANAFYYDYYYYHHHHYLFYYCTLLVWSQRALDRSQTSSRSQPARRSLCALNIARVHMHANTHYYQYLFLYCPQRRLGLFSVPEAQGTAFSRAFPPPLSAKILKTELCGTWPRSALACAGLAVDSLLLPCGSRLASAPRYSDAANGASTDQVVKLRAALAALHLHIAPRAG
jgi:hypothetical protein